jgi:ArsR family transcriptional regulator, arsenate/arsenite/antimonite-responsive transcriptional repressor / arsenate reductase (thioredoxin)
MPVPPLFARMAAHPLRWRLMSELAAGDLRVGELTAVTGEQQSLVSYHLARLRGSGLVRTRRSSFDGRDVYYRLDLARCEELLAACGTALHPGLRPGPQDRPGAVSEESPGTGPDSGEVLFLCTGNSSRSQIAEAFVNARPAAKLRAFSAGTRPKPLHPDAVRVMTEYGIDLAGRQSKHLSVFAGRRFSYVVTLCDRVREACPEYRRHPGYRHWSTQDPSAGGSGETGYPAFRAVAADLDERVRCFLAAVAG